MAMGTDYSTVTEIPGNRVTQEQLERMFHRYQFAATFSGGKDILEVACGAGLGLGYFSRRAKSIVGGDYTENLVAIARHHYRLRVPLLRLDAQCLPFKNQAFDVVVLYEAIYYLAQPERFFNEARRVLRENGLLLIATVNKDWSEFNPSPFSTRYLSIPELSALLLKSGFRVETYGAYSALPKGAKEILIASLKKLAVSLRLIPRTMKGKELLKKVFYGKLITLRGEIEEDLYRYSPPQSIPSDLPNNEFKIIYVVARI